MWNLGNRVIAVVVLISAISGCAFFDSIWKFFCAYIALTIIFAFIIRGWLTLLGHGVEPLRLREFFAYEHVVYAIWQLNNLWATGYPRARAHVIHAGDTLERLYRTHVLDRMAQRRRSTYQLSSESYPSPKNPSRFSLGAGLSPIARGAYRPTLDGTNVENNPYAEAETMIFDRSKSLGKVTSTPLVPWRTEDSRNGDILGSSNAAGDVSPWTKSSSVTLNRSQSRGETSTYSSEISSWGADVGPKMRSRAGGIKTVQTVAGPLLASTRYNIDPKVYADVTSPGLTTRLTKYATEANAKLTHQSQYGTGQFPRVNLNSSPTPLINTKTGKMRMPVTVRVAPPENTRYSPPERRKILSDICHAESKTPPSVVQVLREISLKRHASREDVTFELAKKQRTEGVFGDGLENLEEMTQKRARDDSPRSDEEISPQNKSLRPAKRSKMPSCYDILSSLSSSINVTSGVKRKAIDTPRSGTPDVGKHFKSLDSSHGDVPSSPTLSRTVSEPTKSNKRALIETDKSRNSDLYSPQKKSSESIPQRGILKSPPATRLASNADDVARERFLHDINRGSRENDKTEVKITRESVALQQPQVPVKLTDKLFMKAEPQNIDKLKTLIEEHGIMKPRFTTDGGDEIKKSDIVNMRQTSMKTRLKSMFDAISGKASSSINPEVVIQAEEVKPSSITASLSSSTSTTNVNTSPIATSAVVPIIGKSKPNATPVKHVSFQFQTTNTSDKTSDTVIAVTSKIETKVMSSAIEPKEIKKIGSSVSGETPAPTNTLFQNFNTPISTTSSVPAFSFGSSSLNTSLGTSSATPVPIGTTTSAQCLPSPVATTALISPSQVGSSQNFGAFTTPSTLSGSPVSVFSKSNPATVPTSAPSTQPAEKDSQPSVINFSGQGLAGVPDKSSANPPSASFKFGDQATTAPSAFGSVTPSSFANAATPATTSMFSFGNNATPQTTEAKPFSFGGAAASIAPSASTTASNASQPVSTSIPSTATTGGFSFSSSTAALMKSTGLFGNVTTASTTPSSGFQIPANTTAGFSFSSNAATKPGFSFGTNAPVATTASSGSSISFGTPNSGASASFGAPSTTLASTAPGALPSLLGAQSTTASATTASGQPSLFGPTTTSSVRFGTATTTPSFGMTSNQPSFVASSSTFGTPKTTETSAFGTSGGASTAFAETTTTSGPFSGANANVASTIAPLTFGTSNFAQTKSPPAFGTSVTSTFASGSATPAIFGSQSATPSGFGGATTTATPIFGAPSNPAQSFGTPTTAPPPFGATNTSTTSFGGMNATTPAFSSQNSATEASRNETSASLVFSNSSAAFGAIATTAPPAFGTSITSPSGFGTPATSSFGQPSNPPPAFSANSSSFSGFGAASNAPPPFGSQTTTGTASFGTPSSSAPAFGSGNASTSSFTFGGSQPAAQQPAQQQQSAVFAFGGSGPTSTNNPPSGSAPFQFGNSAPQTSGFNFSGAPSAPALNFSKDNSTGGSFAAPPLGPNSFSAPTTGGMFSIGSGSTGPRSRTSRRRQR